jgi:hypothetical protein
MALLIQSSPAALAIPVTVHGEVVEQIRVVSLEAPVLSAAPLLLQKAEVERLEDLIEIPEWPLQLVGIPMVIPAEAVAMLSLEVQELVEVSMPEVQRRATLEIMLVLVVVAREAQELVRLQEITAALAALE